TCLVRGPDNASGIRSITGAARRSATGIIASTACSTAFSTTGAAAATAWPTAFSTIGAAAAIEFRAVVVTTFATGLGTGLVVMPASRRAMLISRRRGLVRSTLAASDLPSNGSRVVEGTRIVSTADGLDTTSAGAVRTVSNPTSGQPLPERLVDPWVVQQAEVMGAAEVERVGRRERASALPGAQRRLRL